MINDTSKRLRNGKRRGFILLLVLGMLLLITLLVVAFLAHVLSQIKTVGGYRAQTGSLLLSDVAVDLVKAQIDDATSLSNSIWASQPGAIRTFQNKGADAPYGTMYKLYSSASLKSSNPPADLPNDLPPNGDSTDWNDSPCWTDVNAPVQKRDGTYSYPIIDAYNDPADLPGAQFNSGSPLPASFSITPNNVGAPSPLNLSPSSIYPVPMPVQWLYVLKQGQIIAPDALTSSGTITFNNATTVPTTANPIVGRVAYWTDDDTCRVNVNTAAYGTFWDTPRFTSTDDLSLALDQPVNKEYQRYPGHAAMTSLALALPEFAPNGTVTSANAEAIYNLSPRYSPGGSTEGTIASSQNSTSLGTKTSRLYASVDELLFNPPGTFTGSTRTLNAPSLTRPQLETAKFFLTAHSRAPELNLFGLPRVAMWPISSLANTGAASYQTTTDQLIAVCSTLPATTAPSTNTYYFTRAPHTVTLNAGAYVAGLTGSNSATSDVNLPRNTQLLSYLDKLTSLSVPGNLGGGANFDGKYTQLGMRQILTEIFDYVRITNARDALLDPTIGVAFAPANTVSANVAYASNDSITNTSVYQYADGQILPTNYGTWGTYGYGRFGGRLIEADLVFVGVGQGVNSAAIPTVVGYPLAAPSATSNCFPVAQAQCGTVYNNPAINSLLAPASPTATYATALPYSALPTTPAGSAPVGGVPPQGNTAVQAYFSLSFFDPALGFSESTPSFSASISGPGLGSLTLNGIPTKFPATTTDLIRNGNFYYNGLPNNLGSTKPFTDLLPDLQFETASFGYALYSNIISVPNNVPNMALAGGGKITINIYALTGAGSTSAAPIHTYTLDLSNLNGSIPVPSYSTRPLCGSIRVPAKLTALSGTPPSVATTDRLDSWAIPSTVVDSNGESVSNIVDSFNDTVISMVPKAPYGDYRMLANPVTPVTAFQAHPKFPSRLSYGLEYAGGGTGRGSVQGTLVSVSPVYYPGTPTGVNPGPQSATPLVPATVTNPTAGGSTAPPDFDNGFGPVPDGPYINKPDEGVIFPKSTGYRSYYDNTYIGANLTNIENFASPERQVPSPVMFGSLPTGAPVGPLAPQPWQTLLFQPGAPTHPGLTAPKDQYLLDLFWMPQAEPYAISEPFSTAGKVNLNYQILPFTYIDRSTAIQSVLSGEKVAEVGSANAGAYKHQSDTTGNSTIEKGPVRVGLNLSEVNGTLSQFASTFKQFSLFHTAAEICSVYLVPQGSSWPADSALDSTGIATNAAAQTAWYGSGFCLVGDNTREKPYADIYSRITTKSNSFTVFYRVQTLVNPTATPPATWTEGNGVITGELRGSTTIERYLDPNVAVPDYAATSNTSSLDGYNPAGAGNQLYYKWRVVENNRFDP